MEESTVQASEAAAAAGSKKKSNFLKKRRPDLAKPNDESTSQSDNVPEAETADAAATDAPIAEEAQEKVQDGDKDAADNQQPAPQTDQNDKNPQEEDNAPPPESEPPSRPVTQMENTVDAETHSDQEEQSVQSSPLKNPMILEPIDGGSSPRTADKRLSLSPLHSLAPSRLSTARSSVSMAASTRVMLPRISIREAEQNVQQAGFTDDQEGFLGDNELRKLFPDRLVRVHVAIWNVATNSEKKLPMTFEHLLFIDESQNQKNEPNSLKITSAQPDYDSDLDLEDERDHQIPDVYVLGLEEAGSSQEITIRMQDTLGPEFVCYAEDSVGALFLAIFIRRDLIWYTSAPESEKVVNGVQFNPSTKGAIAISFNLFGTSFLFINAHLSANENRYRERVDDFKSICSSLKLPKARSVAENSKSGGAFDCTKHFDVVFFFGDLNFRLQKPADTVRRLLKSLESQTDGANSRPNGRGDKAGEEEAEDETRGPGFEISIYSKLLECDELRRAQLEGVAFADFRESRVTFAPTYKYDPVESKNADTDEGVSTYRLSEIRTPAYTDRILYKAKRKHSVVCKKYTALVNRRFEMSDHRPVYGVFDVEIQPQTNKNSVPPNLGAFNHKVYAEGLMRRAERLNAKQVQAQSTPTQPKGAAEKSRDRDQSKPAEAQTASNKDSEPSSTSGPDPKNDKNQKQTSKLCAVM